MLALCSRGSSARIARGSNVGGGGSGDFITTFPATENPISQGSIWVNGGTDGLNWQNCQTTPGKCFATGYAGATGGNEFDDDLAHLKTSFRTFANNQFAEGIVFRAGGYSPNFGHEIELLLRFTITANSATGYEILWDHTGICNIVKWNGVRGDFVALIADTNIGAAVDGDVLRGEIIGSVVKVYKNTVLVATGPTDTAFTSGQPGVGFWPRFLNPPQVIFDSYCWKSFKAGNL